jgi:hypothetical protein
MTHFGWDYQQLQLITFKNVLHHLFLVSPVLDPVSTPFGLKLLTILEARLSWQMVVFQQEIRPVTSQLTDQKG